MKTIRRIRCEVVLEVDITAPILFASKDLVEFV
jgi:hypothetical protein